MIEEARDGAVRAKRLDSREAVDEISKMMKDQVGDIEKRTKLMLDELRRFHRELRESFVCEADGKQSTVRMRSGVECRLCGQWIADEEEGDGYVRMFGFS